jgi:predicted nucleotidyltransferase
LDVIQIRVCCIINFVSSVFSNLSPEKLAQYRASAEARQRSRIDKIKPRVVRGWEVARRAARLLREQFHVTRVVVFGSLVHEISFHEWSDIDLAVWGLSPEQTFRAMGAVMELDATFEINLVDVNVCPASLLEVIEREGQDI